MQSSQFDTLVRIRVSFVFFPFISSSFIPDFIFCCFFSVFTICTEHWTNKQNIHKTKANGMKGETEEEKKPKRNEKLCSNDGQRREWKRIGKRVRNGERRNRMWTRRNYRFYFAFCRIASWGECGFRTECLAASSTCMEQCVPEWVALRHPIECARSAHKFKWRLCVFGHLLLYFNQRQKRNCEEAATRDEEKQTTKCKGEFTNVHEVYYYV